MEDDEPSCLSSTTRKPFQNIDTWNLLKIKSRTDSCKATLWSCEANREGYELPPSETSLLTYLEKIMRTGQTQEVKLQCYFSQRLWMSFRIPHKRLRFLYQYPRKKSSAPCMWIQFLFRCNSSRTLLVCRPSARGVFYIQHCLVSPLKFRDKSLSADT